MFSAVDVVLCEGEDGEDGAMKNRKVFVKNCVSEVVFHSLDAKIHAVFGQLSC